MKIETTELERLILIDKLPYEKIGKIFNCTGANIKKIAQRRNLNLEKRRRLNPNETFNKGKYKKTFCLNCGKEITHKYKNLYCDTICQHEYRSKKLYNYFLTSPDDFQRPNFTLKTIKKFIIEEQNHVCAICGQTEIWNEKPLIFIIDHIDGDASNNKRENLRCVCPNCDTQLDTYKSKNKNSSRHYYRYRYNGDVSQQSSKL